MAPLLSYPFLLCHHGEQTLENATTASARFSAAERFHLSESCPAAATASCFWRDALQRAFRLLLGRQGSHNLQENSQDHADGASVRSLSSLRDSPGFDMGFRLPSCAKQPGRQKEDWENIYMYGMFGGMALFAVLYMYKPDTTVQTWALAEAVSTSAGHSVWTLIQYSEHCRRRS
jgi:hypothetical protein